MHSIQLHMINPNCSFQKLRPKAMSQELKFSINSTSESAARTRVSTRGFDLIVDEPESLGGTDHAPNPVEYLLAGYAGCINVVAHLVADELDFKLKDFKVDIQGFINPARLFGKSYAERAGYQSLEVTLQTSTLIDPELKKTWLEEIESRCPVNDNLSNPTPIKFSLN